MMKPRVLVFLCGLVSGFVFPAVAQDRFGSAVATDGESVFVLKPGTGRGSAAVVVFGPRDGRFQERQRLTTAATLETGEGFSASLGVEDGIVVVGSGDPAVSWAGRVFRLSSSGWVVASDIGLRDAGPEPAAEPLDMAGLMRIMQPPQRVVALSGSLALASVAAGPQAGVRLFEWLNDHWYQVEQFEIPLPLNARVGASIALRDGLAAVGAPRHGDGGTVLLFAPSSESRRWLRVAELRPDGALVNEAGSAVALGDGLVVVGAPGSPQTPGAVLTFNRTADGWVPFGSVLSGTEAGDGFGSAVAMVDDQLLVGAPNLGGTGAVYRYVLASDGWRDAGQLAPPDRLDGSRFGFAIAGRGGLAVVGAPGADGGLGRASVYRRTDDTWQDGQWLEPGGTVSAITGSEMLCENDVAAAFGCDGVDLLAYLPVGDLGGVAGEGVSDLWGWTDRETGREYALVGRQGGVAVVDVTTPTNPVYLGVIPANRSGPRDIKVYRDHMFFTGDGAGRHGLLVFDLRRLRAVTGSPRTFEPDARYDGIASAHNLVIDTEAGFAYTVGNSAGGQTCGGGLHMIDIREPLHPTFAGCYTDTEGLIWQGRTHDAQCVIYRGPDRAYAGREICFASNETALRIVDVTDKTDPVPLAAATYPGLAYVHQGWLTEDHRYYYLNDELDELTGQTDRTKTVIWDLSDLDDPLLVGEVLGTDGATDHNLYVKGNRMYQANYQAGLRIFDISDPEHPVEIGYFDTTPYGGNPPGFVGAWTAYPYFDSGTVIVSSMNEGLFVLRPRPTDLVP